MLLPSDSGKTNRRFLPVKATEIRDVLGGPVLALPGHGTGLPHVSAVEWNVLQNAH
jgi:hypothetical protein